MENKSTAGQRALIESYIAAREFFPEDTPTTFRPFCTDKAKHNGFRNNDDYIGWKYG